MDNFKNELQVFSPKLYLIAIVVGVSLGTSLFSHWFLGVNTESDVWKKTSIEAIVQVNKAAVNARKQDAAQKQVSDVLGKLKADMEALNDLKVDEILEKYFNKGK